MDDFIITTEYFEGPFDLLLFLVKRQELEIEEISLTKIIKDYLLFLKSRESINLDREADFIAVAATLILLKSKAILPYSKSEEEENQQEEEYNILDQLKEFEKVKHLMEILEKNYREESKSMKVSFPYEGEREFEIYPVSTFLLAETFFKLIKVRERDENFKLKERKYNLREVMDNITKIVRKEKFLNFNRYFESFDSIEDAFFSFFALLELIKRRKVIAVQETFFGDILVFPARGKRDERSLYVN